MRVTFHANEAGFDEDEYCLICWFFGKDSSGVEHGLDLQGDQDGSSDDWGIYLGFDDQSNGAYNRIQSLRLRRDQLSVDTSPPVGWQKNIDGFDVGLSIDEATYEQVKVGLKRVFRGSSDKLKIYV
jgi:hypothetical protein